MQISHFAKITELSLVTLCFAGIFIGNLALPMLIVIIILIGVSSVGQFREI